MLQYIAFLRGINMAGHNSLKMNDLVVMYEDLGFKNVKTYIQSGNVIFLCNNSDIVSDIAAKIEKGISEIFSYRTSVLIRNVAELKSIFVNNPFINEENFDPAKLLVILISYEATIEQIKKVINIDYPPDKFKIAGREIYVYCPNGFGKSKLYTNFFEKKMGVTGTARNWKTIAAILQMAENQI